MLIKDPLVSLKASYWSPYEFGGGVRLTSHVFLKGCWSLFFLWAVWFWHENWTWRICLKCFWIILICGVGTSNTNMLKRQHKNNKVYKCLHWTCYVSSSPDIYIYHIYVNYHLVHPYMSNGNINLCNSTWYNQCIIDLFYSVATSTSSPRFGLSLHCTKASINPDSIVDTWNLKQLTMGQVTKVVRPGVPRCPRSFRRNLDLVWFNFVIRSL